jgi:hypothetical protein
MTLSQFKSAFIADCILIAEAELSNDPEPMLDLLSSGQLQTDEGMDLANEAADELQAKFGPDLFGGE